MQQQETPRRDAWHAIEGRVFGRCMWQHFLQGRKVLLEALLHKRSGRTMIVRKEYDTPVPKLHQRRPWPELIGVTVFDDVAPAATAWEDYERELQSIA